MPVIPKAKLNYMTWMDPNPSSRTGDAVQSLQPSPRVHTVLSSIPSSEETGHGGVCVLVPLTWDTEPVSTGKKKIPGLPFPSCGSPNKPLDVSVSQFL